MCTPIRDPPWKALNQDLPAGMPRRPLLHMKKTQCKIHNFSNKSAAFYAVTCADQAHLSSQLQLTVLLHRRAASPYLILALNELVYINMGAGSSLGCLLTACGFSTNSDLKNLHLHPSSTLPPWLHQNNHSQDCFSQNGSRGSFYPRSVQHLVHPNTLHLHDSQAQNITYIVSRRQRPVSEQQAFWHQHQELQAHRTSITVNVSNKLNLMLFSSLREQILQCSLMPRDAVLLWQGIFLL